MRGILTVSQSLSFESSTVAVASTPSARPNAPRPSVVVALSEMRLDRAAERSAMACAHRPAVRRQARLGRHDRQVGIFEAPAVGLERGPDAAQQLGAARAAPALVSRRKPLADIASPGRAEQRVDQRVERPRRRRNARPDRGGAGSARRPATAARRARRRARPGHCQRGSRCSRTSVRASARSSGVVILKARSSPGNVATAMPESLDERGFVGDVLVGAGRGRVRGGRGGRPAASGRRRARRAAGCRSRRSLGDAFDRVLERQDGDGRAGFLGGGEAARVELGRREGARGVVDGDPLAGGGGQAGSDRVAPARAARDRVDAAERRLAPRRSVATTTITSRASARRAAVTACASNG